MKLTTEETLWLSLADAERDLAEVTKRLYNLHNEFRKYKLSKGDKPKLERYGLKEKKDMKKKEIDWCEKLEGIFFKKVTTPYKGKKHIEFEYMFSSVEDVNKKLSKVIKETIEEMLWLPCCHVSGMHNPEHYKDRKYICESQKTKALERFCKELGINPQTKSLKDCSWCNDYPEHKKGEGLKL